MGLSQVSLLHNLRSFWDAHFHALALMAKFHLEYKLQSCHQLNYLHVCCCCLPYLLKLCWVRHHQKECGEIVATTSVCVYTLVATWVTLLREFAIISATLDSTLLHETQLFEFKVLQVPLELKTCTQRKCPVKCPSYEVNKG